MFLKPTEEKALHPPELKMSMKAVSGAQMTTRKDMWVYELCIRKIETQSVGKNKEKCNTKLHTLRV